MQAISFAHRPRGRRWPPAPAFSTARPAVPASILLLIGMMFAAPRARAEEGVVNAHLGIGAGVLGNDAAAQGISRAGLDLSIQVDLPVHRWFAPQVGYGLVYLPGEGDAESGTNLLMVGARVRILNDEAGYLANLWSKRSGGNPWGNLWVDVGLGYAHAPTVGSGSSWFALELGVGYEFSLFEPIQIGPYLRYRQVFVKETNPAFVCIGVSISFGYPKQLPEPEKDLAPMPRPNIRGVPGDRDGDGVGDASDRCPSTPPEQKVDEKGCELLRGRMIFEDLQFRRGTAILTPEASFTLQRVAEIIAAHPEVKVEIGGHTSQKEAGGDPMQLSLKRAQKVRQELIGRGVSASRISVRGYGDAAPLVRSLDPALLEKNERIEFRFSLDQPPSQDGEE